MSFCPRCGKGYDTTICETCACGVSRPMNVETTIRIEPITQPRVWTIHGIISEQPDGSLRIEGEVKP